jgi:hypothetical protein
VDSICSVVSVVELKGFLKETSTDPIRYKEDVVDMVAAVAGLLMTSRAALQRSSLAALSAVVARAASTVGPLAAVVRHSGALGVMVDALARSITEPEVQGQALALLMGMVDDEEPRSQMVAAGAPAVLMALLGPMASSIRHPVLPRVLELSWSLLSGQGAQEQVCTAEALAAVKAVCAALLQRGSSMEDKATRDDAFLLALLMARDPRAAPLFVETGFLEILMEVATAHEVVHRRPYIQAFNCSSSEEDLSLKLVATDAVLSLLFSEACGPAIAGSEYFLPTLFGHLDHGAAADASALNATRTSQSSSPSSSSVRLGRGRWSPVQARAILRKAIQVAGATALVFPGRFEDLQGARRLYRVFVDSCRTEEGGDAEVRRDAMVALGKAAKQAANAEDLGGLGLVDTLAGLLTTPLERTAEVAALLSALMARCAGNAERFAGAGGLEALMPLLVLDLRTDPEPARVIARLSAAADCMWTACVADREGTGLAFVEKGGVDLILNLLETAPRVLSCQLAGFLGDALSLTPLAVSEFHEWRSPKTRRAAIQVLIRMWIDEEVRLGVPLDVQIPAGSETARLASTRSLTQSLASGPSALTHAVVPPHDLVFGTETYTRVMAADLRFKLHAAIVQVMPIGSDVLDLTEAVKLIRITEFLRLEELSELGRVTEELERTGVRPTSPDEEALRRSREALEAVAAAVEADQDAKRRLRLEEEAEEEARFLTTVVADRAATEFRAKAAEKQRKAAARKPVIPTKDPGLRVVKAQPIAVSATLMPAVHRALPEQGAASPPPYSSLFPDDSNQELHQWEEEREDERQGQGQGLEQGLEQEQEHYNTTRDRVPEIPGARGSGARSAYLFATVPASVNPGRQRKTLSKAEIEAQDRLLHQEGLKYLDEILG